MDPSLERSFKRLEQQKGAVLLQLSTWSDARLNFRPDPANWSTLDVLDHVVKVERALLASVHANLSNSSPVTVKDRLGALMVIGVMRSPARVKVPASATTVIPGATNLSTVIAKWQDARVEMARLLSDLSPEQLDRGLFRHPISGWMNMLHSLRFLSAHLRHHRYQLDRLTHLSHPGLEAASKR